MPKLSDVKETALYVDDLPRAMRFYVDVMGLAVLVEQQDRFCALDVEGKHVLLLFVRGKSNQDTQLPQGVIPAHDGAGPLHIGFSVAESELPAWESHFAAHGVQVLSRMTWPRGGISIYFRDPDGHLLELLSPGVWSTY